MYLPMTRTCFMFIVLVVSGTITLVDALDYPAGVDVWCGKAYRATNASFDPGGWLSEPTLSSAPLLNLQIRPRMNIYLADEDYASFIVDAPISYIHGEPYYNTSFNKQTNLTSPFITLFIDISVDDNGLDLISGANVSVNSTGNEFVFSMAQLPAQFDPYSITIIGASGDGNHSYIASTQLYRLPDRSDGGSTVKIDSLYSGLLVQDFTTNATSWTSLFPYTYYTLWDEWVGKSVDTLNVFASHGYNTIHIVPTGTLGSPDFSYADLEPYLQRAADLGLWIQWGMRGTYKNLSFVQEQVEQIMSWPNMLLWYTADEPDGQVDPLNATSLAYSAIKALDPYHPVSICLNCYNFYFSDYSSGADILMTDVYPISVNTSYSNQYSTACNTTYGCCGCDDCAGTFSDISERFDLFATYQTWLNSPLKPHWAVPQAFGNETFWTRYPTPDEEVVMNMLSVNHGAKGVVMWDYPTEPGIVTVTSDLSSVLTNEEVTGFLLGTTVVATLPVQGHDRVDVSAWMLGEKMLISVVNLEYATSTGTVTITLPATAQAVSSVLWGDGNWTVTGETLARDGMIGLEVDLLILDM